MRGAGFGEGVTWKGTGGMGILGERGVLGVSCGDRGVGGLSERNTPLGLGSSGGGCYMERDLWGWGSWGRNLRLGGVLWGWDSWKGGTPVGLGGFWGGGLGLGRQHLWAGWSYLG